MAGDQDCLCQTDFDLLLLGSQHTVHGSSSGISFNGYSGILVWTKVMDQPTYIATPKATILLVTALVLIILC